MLANLNRVFLLAALAFTFTVLAPTSVSAKGKTWTEGFFTITELGGNAVLYLQPANWDGVTVTDRYPSEVYDMDVYDINEDLSPRVHSMKYGSNRIVVELRAGTLPGTHEDDYTELTTSAILQRGLTFGGLPVYKVDFDSEPTCFGFDCEAYIRTWRTAHGMSDPDPFEEEEEDISAADDVWGTVFPLANPGPDYVPEDPAVTLHNTHEFRKRLEADIAADEAADEAGESDDEAELPSEAPAEEFADADEFEEEDEEWEPAEELVDEEIESFSEEDLSDEEAEEEVELDRSDGQRTLVQELENKIRIDHAHHVDYVNRVIKACDARSDGDQERTADAEARGAEWETKAQDLARELALSEITQRDLEAENTRLLSRVGELEGKALHAAEVAVLAKAERLGMQQALIAAETELSNRSGGLDEALIIGTGNDSSYKEADASVPNTDPASDPPIDILAQLAKMERVQREMAALKERLKARRKAE